MSNHFHLVAIGDQADAISLFMMDLSGLYATYRNAVHRHTGHLWQSRFYSAVLDTAHWATALRYVELNPVRARMVGRAEVVIRPQSPRTCAHAHLARHRTVPAPQAPLADARRMLAASMPGPVLDPILDIPQPQEINRAKVDVTKNAAQCANFERPASMDGDGCAYFLSRHHMMTPTDAHDRKSLGFEKSYHLHA